MRFRARSFARAWLSVAQASAKDADVPVLNRTIAIEEHDTGLRLAATDRYMLLTSFVNYDDYELKPEPALDEAPDRTVVAADPDGRGKGLMAYIVNRTQEEEEDDYLGGDLELDVIFDVRVPPATPTAELEGLEPVYTVLSVPDVERVYLPTVEATYPDWRGFLTTFAPEQTKAIALNPELVERLAKLRRWHVGPLVWHFGGADRVARVEVGDSEPHVAGLVMPMRWELPAEAGGEGGE